MPRTATGTRRRQPQIERRRPLTCVVHQQWIVLDVATGVGVDEWIGAIVITVVTVLHVRNGGADMHEWLSSVVTAVEEDVVEHPHTVCRSGSVRVSEANGCHAGCTGEAERVAEDLHIAVTGVVVRRVKKDELRFTGIDNPHLIVVENITIDIDVGGGIPARKILERKVRLLGEVVKGVVADGEIGRRVGDVQRVFVVAGIIPRRMNRTEFNNRVRQLPTDTVVGVGVDLAVFGGEAGRFRRFDAPAAARGHSVVVDLAVIEGGVDRSVRIDSVAIIVIDLHVYQRIASQVGALRTENNTTGRMIRDPKPGERPILHQVGERIDPVAARSLAVNNNRACLGR